MSDLLRPDDEFVSAYIDDVATSDERAAVDGDPVLLDRAEQLRSVQRALAAPFEPVPADAREAAIAAALSQFEVPARAPVVDLVARRRRRLGPALLGAAAALLVVVLGTTMAIRLVRDQGSSMTASAPSSLRQSADAAAGGAQPNTAMPANPSLPGPAGKSGPGIHAPSTAVSPTATSQVMSATGSAGAAETRVQDLGSYASPAALLSAVESTQGGATPGGGPAAAAGRGAAAVDQIEVCVPALTATDAEIDQPVYRATASLPGDAEVLIVVFDLNSTVHNANGNRRAYVVVPDGCAVISTATYFGS